MLSFSKETLVALGRHHWKHCFPEKYRDLMAAGTLDQELLSAAEMTLQLMHDDQESGYSRLEAWERNQERYLLLPEPMPANEWYDAIVEFNRMLREAEDD